jgi:hypothetical protein
MWMTPNGINTDTMIYCFRRCCRYEPLIAKLRRHSRDNFSIAELFNIAQRYADEDPTVDSDDKYGQRRDRRPVRSDTLRDDYRFSMRPSNGKRRADGSNTEFVANTNYGQREPKYSRRDSCAPREDRPPGKRFNPHSLLDALCIYHSRDDKPSTHTTANCFSLKQIEKARRAKENDGGDQNKDRNKDQDQPMRTGSVASSAPSTPSPGWAIAATRRSSHERWLSTQSSRTPRVGSTGPSRASCGSAKITLHASNTQGKWP